MNSVRLTHPWARRVARGCFFLGLLGMAGCATTLRGQVLDAQTGQPIAGAVILGVWTKGGGLPGLSHTNLVGVREAETDAAGRFTLDGVSGLLLDEQSITVYKFGFVAWNNQWIFPGFKPRPDPRVPAEIRLEPFPSGGKHLDHIMFIESVRSSSLYGINDDPKFDGAFSRERRMH